MEEVERQRQVGVELRRYPRYRVSAPFPCAFSLLGLKRWTAVDRNGLGVVLDVSLRGAKVMKTWPTSIPLVVFRTPSFRGEGSPALALRRSANCST